MSRDGWFRRTTWSPADRAEFFSRLKRTRSRGNQAQYLRIQAGHLAGTSVETLVRAGLELLDHMLQEYPDSSTELAAAHHQRGVCLAQLGEYVRAIDAYRRALEVQRVHPHALTTAHTAFAELAVTLNRRDLFPEALTVLEEFSRVDVFPIHIFKREAAHALIAADGGEMEAARSHARRALAAASATESGFRYHVKVGLVGFVDPRLVERIRQLSDA